MILKMLNKIMALTIIFTLIFEQSGFAQVAGPMGIPAYINGYISPDKFRPLQLRSLNFDRISNDFDLYLDKGDLQDLKPGEIKENAAKLSEYFQIGLRLPNSTFWVNLRPDAQDQIIDPWLEKTELGKVMLEADLQLKKDMANFTSPKTPEGKNYWDNLYKKAEELFGQSEITIPTLTRPWIVPGEILIRETSDNAYIYKAALKVMLEQDHLKDAPEYKFDDPRLKTLNEYSSELIRREILPKLTREVNSSKKYAGLRQVYYSLVLAQWFKQSNLAVKSQVASKIDSYDLNGLTSKKSWSKTTYFKAYQKSFAKGEYKLQETVNRLSGISLRQYFSGGEKLFVSTSGDIARINPLADGGTFNRPFLPEYLENNLIKIPGNPEETGSAQGFKKDGGSALSLSQKVKVWAAAMKVAWNLAPVEKVTQGDWDKAELMSLWESLQTKAAISKLEAFGVIFFPITAAFFGPLVIIPALGLGQIAYWTAFTLGSIGSFSWLLHLDSMGSERISRVMAAEEWLAGNRLQDSKEKKIAVYFRDGGNGPVLSPGTRELYSAINEIRLRAVPDQDFVERRLARVKGLIKENKYTSDEIRMVQEQLNLMGPILERVIAGKINSLLFSVASLTTGGLTAAALIFSGMSLVPMIVGVGFTAAFGIGAAYSLYKLFSRDIPARDFYNGYDKEVNKILAEASRDGGTQAVIDETLKRHINTILKSSQDYWEKMNNEPLLIQDPEMFEQEMIEIRNNALEELVMIARSPDKVQALLYLNIVAASADSSKYARDLSNEALTKVKRSPAGNPNTAQVINKDGGNIKEMRVNVLKDLLRKLSKYGDELRAFMMQTSSDYNREPSDADIKRLSMVIQKAISILPEEKLQSILLQPAESRDIRKRIDWSLIIGREEISSEDAALALELAKNYFLRLERKVIELGLGYDEVIPEHFLALARSSREDVWDFIQEMLSKKIEPNTDQIEKVRKVLTRYAERARMSAGEMDIVNAAGEYIWLMFARKLMLGSEDKQDSLFTAPWVLVVDDNPYFARELAVIYSSLGFRVLVEESIAEAKKTYEWGPKNGIIFDLVSTDRDLPGESGIEFAKWIKGQTPVILLSGGIDPDERIAVDPKAAIAAKISKINYKLVLPEVIKELNIFSGDPMLATNGNAANSLDGGKPADPAAVKAMVEKNIGLFETRPGWLKSYLQMKSEPGNIAWGYALPSGEISIFSSRAIPDAYAQQMKFTVGNGRVTTIRDFSDEILENEALVINVIEDTFKELGKKVGEWLDLVKEVKDLSAEHYSLSDQILENAPARGVIKNNDPDILKEKMVSQKKVLFGKAVALRKIAEALEVPELKYGELTDDDVVISYIAKESYWYLAISAAEARVQHEYEELKAAFIERRFFSVNKLQEILELASKTENYALRDGGTNSFTHEKIKAPLGEITVFKYKEQEIASLIRQNNGESIVINKNKGYIKVKEDHLVMVAPNGKVATSKNAPLIFLVKNARVMSEKEWNSGNMADKKDGGNTELPLDTGGIDFRAMPAAIQPMADPTAGVNPPALISLRDLDKRWSKIQSKIYRGEMPYQEIKLYVSSCCGQKAAAKQLEQVSEGITNILQMEEDRALPTAPELKEILACLG
jgi:CheY-like chemotaxis protein